MGRIKILLTGAAGNIGSALAARLVQDPRYYVVMVDNLLSGSRSKLPEFSSEQGLFVNADVNERRDISEIMLAHRFDYVFHYAAMVGVQRTQENPVAVLKDIDGMVTV